MHTKKSTTAFLIKLLVMSLVTVAFEAVVTCPFADVPLAQLFRRCDDFAPIVESVLDKSGTSKSVIKQNNFGCRKLVLTGQPTPRYTDVR